MKLGLAKHLVPFGWRELIVQEKKHPSMIAPEVPGESTTAATARMQVWSAQVRFSLRSQ